MKTINIFIHGLASSSDTWNSLVVALSNTASDSHGKNFQHYNIQTNRILDDERNTYYAFFDYESKIIASDGILKNLFRKINGRKSEIDDLGIDDLVELFRTYVDAVSANFDKINIFAHSLGGVITLRYLLAENVSADKINSIVYFASPFLGSQNSDDLSSIFRHKRFWQVMKPTRILRQLETNSNFINSLSQDIEKQCDKILQIDCTFFYAQMDARIENPQNLIAGCMSFQNVQHDHKSIVEDARYCQIIYPQMCDKIFSHVRDSNIDEREDEVVPEEIDLPMSKVEYQDEDDNTHYLDISCNKITEELYNEIMDPNSENKGTNEPIDNINWFQAITFCNQLSDKLNLEKVYDIKSETDITINNNANGYRLPSVKEMEYILDKGADSIKDFSTYPEWTNDKKGQDYVTMYNSSIRTGYERNETSHNAKLGSKRLGFRIIKKGVSSNE